MSKRKPTRDFRPVLDDDARDRIWRKIQARSLLGRRAGRTPARWMLLAAALLLIVASVVAAPAIKRALEVDAKVDAPVRSEPVASVVASARVRAPAPVASVSVESSAPVAPSAAVIAAPSPAPTIAAWRVLEDRGAHDDAYTTLGPGGVAAMTKIASVDELFALADVARLSGHPKEAVAPLERVVREYRADPRTSLAAFTLGRVYLDLGDPSSAAWAYQRAIDYGVPGGLEEDAYARLVEAKARSGDAPGARVAYDRARTRFPEGTHDAEMRHWIDPK